MPQTTTHTASNNYRTSFMYPYCYEKGSYSSNSRSKELCVESSKSGYTYFGARYYDADLSVWLSVDPLASNAPSWSPYNYVWANPISNVDDDGRWGYNKAVRKQRKAIKKYGAVNVGKPIVRNSDGEYGFMTSKDGFKDHKGDDKIEGATVSANATFVYNSKSKNNFEMFGANLDANRFQRGMVNLSFLAKNAVNFWSGFFGGPSGPEVNLNDKSSYLASMLIISKVKLPTKGKYKFNLNKRWKKSGQLPTSANGGFIDKYGNSWKRPKGFNIQGELHWDVTLSRKGKRKYGTSKNHLNINNYGEIAH